MITDQELDKGLLTLKMIWFAMLLSLAIYLFVGLYGGMELRPSMDKETLGIFRILLYAFAFITLIITRFVRRLILSGKGQGKPATPPFRHSALQRYTTATVIALTMSDSIGIYGLLLFFLGKNSTDLYLLLLISAAALWMYRPRKDEVVDLIPGSYQDSTTRGIEA